MEIYDGFILVEPEGEEKVISGGVEVPSSYYKTATVKVAGANSKFRAGDKVMYREWSESKTPIGTMVNEYDVILRQN